MTRRTFFLAFAGLAILGIGAGLVWDRLAPGARTANSPTGGSAGDELTVAAAADLRLALDDAARVYGDRTRTRLVISYGSSGQLTQQIENGAPFDLFLSADRGFIDRLSRGGHTVPGTEKLYARGRLVLVLAPKLNRAPAGLADLKGPDIRYVAIANPDHAPYGRAARQALERAGLWDEVRPRIVFGENILQTFQLVQTGQADAGLVALSLVISGGLPYALVSAELHDPIDQGLAVLRQTRNEPRARDFVGFILSPEGQAILKKYGFEPAGGGN